MILKLEVNVIGTSMENQNQIQNQILNILIGNKEVNNQNDVNKELYVYQKNLFSVRQHLSEHDKNNCLNVISKFPQLSNEQSLECEKCITNKELFEALKSMPNNKSPGNDSLTKELFETLQFKVKNPLL